MRRPPGMLTRPRGKAIAAITDLTYFFMGRMNPVEHRPA
jgi:hypothetical protein